MSSTPTKPPRGVKYASKEPTGPGLLVSVIKTLDASETNEERDKEKQKIEKEYRKSDQRLNVLVSRHDGDLTQIMLLFSKVSSQVTTSKEKIHSVKENLYACKKLLRCRRDELKKLWTDAVQQKYVLEMLEQINELRKVPNQVTAFIAKKHYLHATKSLTYAIHLGEGPLRDVEGLHDLRQDLELRKGQLYSKLIEEIMRLLYHTSTVDALTNFQRHGSGRGSNFSASPFQRSSLRRSAERAEANQKVKKALLEMQQKVDADKVEIMDSNDLMDPELNMVYYMGIIIECFGLLKKVPESLETIKVQMQSELLEIVTKTTQHLLSVGSIAATEFTQHPLLTLLESIFDQFKLVAGAHAMALKNYQSVMQRYSINYKRYDLTDLWMQAQSVFQLVLTDYLDIQNAAADERTRTNFPDQTININNYFTRRKLQNKKTLFKFDKSSHIITHEPENSSAKEHRRNLSDISNDETLLAVAQMASAAQYEARKRDRILVCDPDPAHIKSIYLPMVSYIQEIEELMKTKQQCSLNVFLATHVKETFLAQGHNRSLQNTIDSLSKSHDAWKVIISPEEMKSFGLSRPLLQSTVMVENKITETKTLIHELPHYSEDLLKNVCSLLKTYRETCQAAYRGIVQPETEDKRIQSVTWLADEDISRFLKTLPNWTDLKSSKMRSKATGTVRTPLKAGMFGPSEEESPTQVQYRNIKEADMLSSNLGESEISKNDILSDVGVLKELAILQESMEWFSYRITEFANDLRKPIYTEKLSSGDSSETSGTQFIINDGTIKVLTNLALEFDELANTCLLVLHLEVRVQCFHYLRLTPTNKRRDSLSSKADTLEPDPRVVKLTKVLSDMDEALGSTLHPRKAKYIFEGLAHLAARILIMSSNYMEKIDQYGVQLMCRNALALQQTLSSITASREVALDHARNYYEMFYMDPDELITNIVEKGSHFSEMQYFHALQLICKSRSITDSNSIANYQQRLSDILGTKPLMGITV